MKTLLIVFIVLLFLLTLLSSFGGSIRPMEPFYDSIPAFEPETFAVPEKYETDDDALYNPSTEYFYEEVPANEKKQTGAGMGAGMDAGNSSGIESTEVGSPSSKFSTPVPEGFLEQIRGFEKFDVPEPFMNEEEATQGAPF